MRIVVIGVGGPMGDDAVGLRVAERLAREAWPPGVRVLARERPGLDLALDLRDADAAVVVDAVRPAGAPGRVRRLARAELARAGTAASTHGFGVAEALALAEALEALPSRVALLGIEAERVRAEELSPAVAGAVDGACREVRALVEELGREAAAGAGADVEKGGEARA